MFIGGFCVSWSCGDLNFTTKALLSQPIFGEGIVNPSMVRFGQYMLVY